MALPSESQRSPFPGRPLGPFSVRGRPLPVPADAGGSTVTPPVEPALARPTRSVGRAPAIAVCALAWTLAALAAVLVPFTEPAWHPGQWYFLVDLADAIVFGAVAGILLARGRHPVAWILAACAVGGGLAALGFQWSVARFVHPGLPALDPLSSAQNSAWVPGTLAVILVLPWLVRAAPLGRGGKVAIGAGALTIASITLARVTDPFPWPDGPTMAPFAIRSQWWAGVIEDAFPYQVGAVCVLGFVAAIDVTRRWRSGPDRRGLGWLAVACALMTAAFVPLALPVTWVESLPVWLTPVLHLTSQLFFPAALLVAVLGQRLRGLDVAVDRATVYGLLTGGVVAVYLSTVWLLDIVLPDGRGPGLIGVAIVAIGVQPARAWLQARVDHLVRGEANRPLDALSRVGEGLGTASDDQALATVVTDAVREAFRLGGVAVDVEWPNGSRRLAQSGTVLPDADTIDLFLHQEQVGVLVVSARRGERLDRATLDAVRGMAPVMAATVQLEARTRALRESRAQIAQARDDERRRLRSELHDGFGPALAGVGLGLQAVKNLIHRDVDAATTLIDRLSNEVDDRVEAVRTLARGLLPPVLEERGLVPALVELAERHQFTDGIRVEVEVAPDAPAGDLAVARALYGIAAEALRNTVRHSHAESCRIQLGTADGHLVLRVSDDGVGFDPSAATGIGLRSMHERAQAVAGDLRIDAGPDRPGATIEVQVPLLDEVDLARGRT